MKNLTFYASNMPQGVAEKGSRRSAQQFMRSQNFVAWLMASIVVQCLFAGFAAGENIRGFVTDKSKEGFYNVWQNGDPLPKINLRDKRTGKSEIKQKAVVLVHGWNPDGVQDPISWSASWRWLSSQLVNQLNQYPSGKEWSVIDFNWARAAATGETGFNFKYLGIELRTANIGAAVIAATNADRRGYDYARALHEANPDLRQVQFIAHSAGSWLARSAIQELTALNPLVVCQLTLLDPYVEAAGIGNTALSRSTMESLASNHRVWRLQNFYSLLEKTGPFTSTVFSGTNWENYRVDGFFSGPTTYSGHSGPIVFYGDTIAALYPQSYIHPDLSTASNWDENGASNAFWRADAYFPRIHGTSQTQVSRAAGQNVVLDLDVGSISNQTYRWYEIKDLVGKLGRQITALGPASASGSYLTVPIVTGTQKEIVCEIMRNGTNQRIFSPIFKVSEDKAPAPGAVLVLTSAFPVNLSADVAGNQTVTVTGRGFSNTTGLWVVQPSGASQLIVPTIRSSTELSFFYGFTGKPGKWSVWATNGSSNSGKLSFYVSSATPVAPLRMLSRIAIDNLPGTMMEGQTAGNVRIHAFYTDGTDVQLTSPTSANWSIQPAALTFSAPYAFSAGQVAADTETILTAIYTEGGIERQYQTTVKVQNNTSSGGVVTGEIIKNGPFANYGVDWIVGGADFHITSDYSFSGHTGGYAWMATPSGGQGNNLGGNISQMIDLPSNASALTLKFSCAISVQNPATVTATDRVTVMLKDENDGNPITLFTVDPVNQPSCLGQWATFSANLLPYKGTRRKLVFIGATDYSNPATLRLDDVRVELTAASPTLVDLAISGLNLVKEGLSGDYMATASFSSGAPSDVSTTTTWSVSENATISASGRLTALQVPGQRTARITASYSSGGIIKTAVKEVVILDTAPLPAELAIYGAAEVEENSGGSFTAVMKLSSGVYQEVSGMVYWTIASGGGTLTSQGQLYTSEVASDTVITLKAAYEQDGVKVEAELPVTVLNRMPPVLPATISITGPASVNEGGLGLFDAEVTYADGSKKFVRPIWLENSRFTTISEFGVLSAEEVLADQMLTLTASYTDNLQTVSITKTVTITNTIDSTAEPEIIMPALVEIPVDRQAAVRLQTAHPAVSATATGLPPGLTFNSGNFTIEGTPLDVGTWEVLLSATNDFGTVNGILLLKVSEDAGPENIRFTKAEIPTVPADKIAGDGEGGCYLYSSNSVAHRNAAGVIDMGPLTYSGMTVYKVSGSPSGFAVTGRMDGQVVTGGRTIQKAPNGEAEAVVIVYNKAGTALWHDAARSSHRVVTASSVVLNTDGSLFWGFSYRDGVSFQTLGVGLELMNPGSPGQSDCAVIRISPSYTFSWGHRWGGNQDESLDDISPLASQSCRVVISTYSSSLLREPMQYPGLFQTSWSRGGSPAAWRLIENVFDHGGFAEAQVDSQDSSSFVTSLKMDPLDSNRYWMSGDFSAGLTFKRYRNGSSPESIGLPAAANGSSSGFVIKSGPFSAASAPAVFSSLMPVSGAVNRVSVWKLAPGSDGTMLSTGVYSPGFDYLGTRYIDHPTDYTQTNPRPRFFIAGHDSENSMRWVLPGGGADGGSPLALESLGNDRWALLVSCTGDAKFGRLPVIPGGGTVLVDITRKVPQAEIPETYDRWLSSGLSAGGLASLRSVAVTTDLNGNGRPDLLDYAFGTPSILGTPAREPKGSMIADPDTKGRLAITFDRALGRSDSKIAVEVSDDFVTWYTGSVYAQGADIPVTLFTKEVSRMNMGGYERITVADNRPSAERRFFRIKATTGTTPVPDVTEPSGAVGSLLFQEDFGGPELDSSKWTVDAGGNVSIENENAILTSGSEWTRGFRSAGKASFQKNKLIIEWRMKRDQDWDAILEVGDAVNSLYFMDSSYGSSPGLQLAKSGAFGEGVVSGGSPTTGWMEYRATIEGNTVTLQRGPTLSNLTEMVTTTLNSQIQNHAVSLSCRNGGKNAVRFDWIRVR